MSKELKDIENNVMDQIHQGKIKMKPKVYFVLGSILTFVGLVSAIITSIFMVGLTRFLFRTNYGWRAQYRLEQIFSEFPFWIILVAIIGLVLGIWLIRKYDFSYKINHYVLIVGFILAIIVAGLLIDIMGINNVLMRHNPMKNMMRNHIPLDNNFLTPSI